MKKILEAIYSQVEKDTKYQAYADLRDFCKEVIKTDIPLAVEYLVRLSDRMESVIPKLDDIGEMRKMYSLHKSVWRSKIPTEYANMQIRQRRTGKVSGIAGKVDMDVGVFNLKKLDYQDTRNESVCKGTLKVGDRVRVENPVIFGTNRKFRIFSPHYDVIQVSGNRIVIGLGGLITAAVHRDNLERI